jgi:hypothetical protein
MMSTVKQLDPIAAVPDESPSRVLRLGKDEMNLAEFPITLLTDRVPKGQKIIQYQDQVFDEKLRRPVRRKLTISADEAYGLPTAIDDDVILGLIQLTKLANDFTAREVQFSRLDLIRMLDWPDSGASYKRLATSLKRWLGVSLVYENAWWDRKQQTWTTKGFHIIDNFELNDGRSIAQAQLFPSKVIWNQAVFESFQAGYLKSIDYGLYLKLEHPTYKRMYRFLSKRMYHRPDWTFDLRDLAFEHVGLSRNYSGNAGKIKEKLQPAIGELEEVGFLVPLPKDERYQKGGKDWKIRLVHRTDSLALPASAETFDAAPLAAELVQRGVSQRVAAELVQQHPASTIQAKLEVFDWLAEKKDRRIAKSPAGYLVKSIADDYSAPKGFMSRADREQREQARKAREREAVEKRRQEREQEERDQAEQKAVATYWDSLSPEQQAQLQSDADAQADAETLALEKGPLKRLARQIRRDEHIRQLLNCRELVPADA